MKISKRKGGSTPWMETDCIARDGGKERPVSVKLGPRCIWFRLKCGRIAHVADYASLYEMLALRAGAKENK